ncbi:hypothetical protein ACFOW1_15275 [Parasediminibacterium paludis]|uniref:Transporter n=1 Tax=Parasediminibacterium paludis TaxID=908966 RepID=A0ABV8PZ53_9BACT
MKKIIIAIVFIFSIQFVSACDICGCSTGNYFVGPFPRFHKHFFGTRYTFRSFRSEVANDPTQFSKDFYQTVELWGGWNIGKKWQLLAFLPYNFNKQHSDDTLLKSNGFGDATIMTNYNIFSNRNGFTSSELWFGGGIKLPVGKFAADPNAIVASANNQAGTGSYDFLLNALYVLRMREWSINSNINYKLNGSKNAYKFGDRLSTNIFISRIVGTKFASFSPNIGLLFEHLNANELSNTKVASTGGNGLLTAVGTEVNFGKIIVGTNVQLPISQNLSDGQTTTKVRGMLHLSYAF